MNKVIPLASVALIVSACAADNAPRVIDSKYIGQVQRDLHQQVGIYAATIDYYRKNPENDPGKPLGVIYKCGDSSIDFDITSLKVDLLTELDDTTTAKGSATIPVVTAIVVTPSAQQSKQVNNVQELIYNDYVDSAANIPIGYIPPTKPEDFPPITRMLLQLRYGMVVGAQDDGRGGPVQCFRDIDLSKPGDAADSYKIAVTAVSDGQYGVALGLGIVSLSANKEIKNTDSNTITVSFKQHLDPKNPKNGAEIVAGVSPAPAKSGIAIITHGQCRTNRSAKCVSVTVDGKTTEFPAGIGVDDYIPVPILK